MTERTWTIRDPFAGDLDAIGETLEEAIESLYDDIDPAERPSYVWYEGRRIEVPQ